jgi:hypothetical protein
VYTVIAILLLVTLAGAAHVAFEVNVTVIFEPTGSNEVVYVEPVFPGISIPLFFH